MNRKILQFVVGGLMALSLPLAACAPAPATTPTAPTTPTTPTAPAAPAAPTAPATEKPKEVVPAAEVKPKYGGTLYLALGSDITTYAAIESC